MLPDNGQKGGQQCTSRGYKPGYNRRGALLKVAALFPQPGRDQKRQRKALTCKKNRAIRIALKPVFGQKHREDIMQQRGSLSGRDLRRQRRRIGCSRPAAFGVSRVPVGASFLALGFSRIAAARVGVPLADRAVLLLDEVLDAVSNGGLTPFWLGFGLGVVDAEGSGTPLPAVLPLPIFEVGVDVAFGHDESSLSLR